MLWILIRSASTTQLVELEFNGPFNSTKVMLSWSVYLTTLFLGRLSPLSGLTSACTYSFARNRQLPFLNQWKRENDHRKYCMINLHARILPEPVGLKPWPPDQQGVGCAWDRTRGFLITSQSDMHPTEPQRPASTT